MRLIARFPRFAAWVVTLALVGAGTWGGIFGLQALEPVLPAHLAHVHGIVVAIRANGWFAVQVSGQADLIWFRPAPGSAISLDHLRRHMRERAATDVYYQATSPFPTRGALLAWDAD
jgi:hypothetical protein